MLKDLKNNNRGIVFITALIIIIITMTLAISVLSLNISQVKSSETELKNIQAGILADGLIGRMLINQMSSSPSDIITYTETVGNTPFTLLANVYSAGALLPGTNSVPFSASATY